MFCFIYFLVFWFAWITIGWLSLACACRSIYVCISLKHGFISLSVSLQFIFKKFSLLIVVVGFFFYIYIYYIYRFFKYFFIIKKKNHDIYPNLLSFFCLVWFTIASPFLFESQNTHVHNNNNNIWKQLWMIYTQ